GREHVSRARTSVAGVNHRGITVRDARPLVEPPSTDRWTRGPDERPSRPPGAPRDAGRMTTTHPSPGPGGTRPGPGGPAGDGIDLRVERGEIFAVLGPNGAGKTTTVEILEGFRHRDAGEVRVLGEDPQTAGRAWRSRLGVVLQDSRDQAELTVAELVRHFATVYPRPRDPDEVIDAVGLREKARTRTRQLSGGQRRRLD